MVFHPRDTSCPAMLRFQGHGFNARKLSHFKDLGVGDEVTPMDVKEGTYAALMVMLDETEVATIDDPGLSTIQESGQHNSFVDIDLRVFL